VVDVGLLMIMFGVIIIVENDEEQHRSYMTVCEVKRIAEIVESWAVEGTHFQSYSYAIIRMASQLMVLSRRCHRRNA
jgi:hypothetical protein